MSNKKEDEQELSHISDKELVSRLDLPEDKWIHLPNGVSIFDYIRMSEEEQEKARKLGLEQYKEDVNNFQAEQKRGE